RLVCLCLAAFFLVHLAVGALVSLAARPVIWRVSRIDAVFAARVLLTLRLLPATAAAIAVAGICVPSYLWLEPRASTEQAGLVCMAAALLGLTILAFSMARGWDACRRSLRFVRHCQRTGREIDLPGGPAPIWLVEGVRPLLALTGVIRPCLVISQPVVSAL